ncbi:Arabinogalactan peptide [Melia azedarach]|uniref:Arabinogalactan peptide n=1 Tax=Melia azedarach TaxID=155640 RepID=A0ACC1YXA7_MELAZ|nr:Arabinogalactan peptide [Melia azedarach]
MDVISSRAFVCFLALLALVFAIVSPPVEAQSSASSPAPAPVSDGTSIDQGIAYVLMLVALVLTYLIHPLDASSSSYTFF